VPASTATQVPAASSIATTVQPPTENPKATNTPTLTPKGAPTATSTSIPANTATNTPTATGVPSPVNTATNTPTNTPANTSTPTSTPTPLPLIYGQASVSPSQGPAGSSAVYIITIFNLGPSITLNTLQSTLPSGFGPTGPYAHKGAYDTVIQAYGGVGARGGGRCRGWGNGKTCSPAATAIALGLATIGVYGVMAYLVNQGVRELGIRMALGATPGAILRLIVGQGLSVALAGVTLGLLGALAVTRLMSSLLFAVEAHDPITFSTTALLLTIVAGVATAVPAFRAARIDPMVSLRSE